MENLLYQIIGHIKAEMPQLATVDEDYGQLEAIDKEGIETYPVIFPAVLVDMPETDWSCIGQKSQRGRARVNVRLVIDCYDDTHCGSGTMEAISGRAAMADELHRLLQGFRPDDDGEMVREKSRFYTWSHGIKVYESLYSVAVQSFIRETVTAAAPRRVVVSATGL